MPLLSKRDLEYDYTWSSRPNRQQDPVPDDNPGRDVFDADDGNDVLDAINNYAEEKEITDKRRALEIERKMHENMSRDISTQRGVRDWMDSIFGKK